MNNRITKNLKKIADDVYVLETTYAECRAEVLKLKQQVSVLWDVAYEGLERGDAFYAIVKERTGQTREQAEIFFNE